MPVRFTDEEIELMEKKYNSTIKLLSDYDIEIEDKFNIQDYSDPSLVGAYRAANEVKIKRETQDRILTEMKEKYRGFANNDDSSIISSSFKVEDTEEARQYNENLYRAYLNNPDQFIFAKIDGILQIRADAVNGLNDNFFDNAIFYRNNFEAIEDAEKIANIIETNPNITKELKETLPSLKTFLDVLTYPKKIATKYESLDKIVFPFISEVKARKLIDNGFLEDVENKQITDRVKVAAEPPAEQPSEYFKKVERNGADLHSKKEFLARVIAVKTQNNKEKIVDIDKFATKKEQGVHISTLDEFDSLKARLVTNAARDTYSFIWQDEFQRIRKDNLPFSIDRIQDEHKGGFFERIRKTTSPQYKNMIQALREFNDPNSPNYLNYNHLKSKAQEYIVHKESQGYGRNKQYRGTSLARKNLADAILRIKDSHDKILNETRQSYYPKELDLENKELDKPIFNPTADLDESNDFIINNELINRVPAVNPEDVDINNNNIENDNNIIENDVNDNEIHLE